MRSWWIVILFLPIVGIAQKKNKVISDTVLNAIPIKDGSIVYEKIYYLDSVSSKEQVFNAVKSVLIKNTNYKYSKVDEDRVSGSITAEISFDFIAKPGIAKLVFTGKSFLSIDIKEGRYRVRLFNNSHSTIVMGYLLGSTMEQQYDSELDLMKKGKWKEEKSTIISWHDMLTKILNGFSASVIEGLKDDF